MTEKTRETTEPEIALGDVSVALSEAPNEGAASPEFTSPSPNSGRKRWLWRILAALVVLALVFSSALVVAFFALSHDLPEIRSLADYRPKQATVVYGRDGQVVARFATERRTVVPLERVPKVLIQAVLASEDAEFFSHQGIDYFAILRCAKQALTSGRLVCGGSTITQQMVKTLLLSPEQTAKRKLKELILAKRVEDALTKEEILFLYLNQINFGHGAYGVEEAARTYFGKHIEEVTLEEAALLAGLPQQPSRLDPYRRPDRAMRRRAYVLRRMRELDLIDQATYERADKTPIRVDWKRLDADLDNNNSYIAHVKKLLGEMPNIGPERAQDGGLRVYVGLDPRLEREATKALRQGLKELDKRQGWRGPLFHLDPDELSRVLSELSTRHSTVAPSVAELAEVTTKQPVVWDLSDVEVSRETGALDVVSLVHGTRFLRLAVDQTVAAPVVDVDEAAKVARVAVAPGVQVTLPLQTALLWARPFSVTHATPIPQSVGAVLKKGDVILIRTTQITHTTIVGVLEQRPKVEGALVAIDPSSREVLALVGGYGTGAGNFNRATQAQRQAGSTFKPFVYGAALASGRFGTVSTCLDRPHVYRDPWTGKPWKPENFDGHFHGEITIRLGLTKSKNLCSVWLTHEVGLDAVIDFARRAGITSPLPKSDTIALGSASVTPLEIVNAYATLAARGMYTEPIFIKKVVDSTGHSLSEAAFEPKKMLPDDVTFLLTSLMQSVVEDGTAQRVKALGRPVAGKTGTTNESKDAWFVGFTPALVAGVWTGFDDNQPLGPAETGGRAAIPIWLDFAVSATKDSEVHEFVAPSNIVFASVDPKTGRLAAPSDPGATVEPFIAGSEPTDMASPTKDPSNFGLDDFE